jgi:23S rRNA 5-hydroxycytidine C2501 synthase
VCYRRSSSGTSTYTFSPDPDKTFNRGYTPYFLRGRAEKMASLDTQKAVGPYVGTVMAIGNTFFRFKGESLQNGDGLCFFTDDKKLLGFRVDRAETDGIYPNTMKGLTVGVRLYRNHNQALSRILGKPSATRKIGVDMDLHREGTDLRLSVQDEDGNISEYSISQPFEPARDATKSAERIIAQLSSTGNTPFRAIDIRYDLNLVGFLPVHALNHLRREALDGLTAVRRSHYLRDEIRLQPNTVQYPEKKLDYRANVLNDHAKRFYERHGATVSEGAFETLSHTTGKTVMTTRYCIRHQLEYCPKLGRPARSIKAPLRISDARHTYRLEFDCRECRMWVILESARRTEENQLKLEG